MTRVAGEFIPVLPLDVLILKLMPKEGTIFMGVYPEGPTVKEMAKQIGNGQVPATVFSSRVRNLHRFGYAKSFSIPRQNTAIWQVTPKGEQFIRDHPLPEVSDERSG